MILFVVPLLVGVAVGIVMTALASAVNTPTRGSFLVNLLVGEAGYLVGLFIGFARAKLLPDDSDAIWAWGIWTAVLACVAHELTRWWSARRRVQQADR